MRPTSDELRAQLRAVGRAREGRGPAPDGDALGALLGAAAERAGERSAIERASGAAASACAAGLCAATLAGAQLAPSPAGDALESPLRMVVRKAFEPTQVVAQPPSSDSTDDEDR